MAKSIKAIKAEMVDREAIRDCLNRICRAIDRADIDVWRECIWPEATDNHAGLFAGKMTDLLEQSLPFLEKLQATTHIISNIVFDIDGDFAKTETYVQGCHIQDEPEQVNIIGTGRYLDRFERRGDEWRMIERNLVLDWFMNVPREGDWSKPHFDHVIDGTRAPKDFSINFFASGPGTATPLSE